MAEAWEYYSKQPPIKPVYGKPLCPHQLIRERVKVAHDLLALSLADCAEGMDRDMWTCLQTGLVAVQRLQNVLGKKPRCACNPTVDFEEDVQEETDDDDF